MQHVVAYIVAAFAHCKLTAYTRMYVSNMTLDMTLLSRKKFNNLILRVHEVLQCLCAQSFLMHASGHVHADQFK